MEYNTKWDLSTIPENILRSELGRRSQEKRRNRKGGYLASCSCGTCQTCMKRKYQRAYRAKNKETL